MDDKKTKDEELLIELFRAITELDEPSLVSTADVGDILHAYKGIVEVKNLEGYEVRSVQFGFVAGLAAIADHQQQPSLIDEYGTTLLEPAPAQYYDAPAEPRFPPNAVPGEQGHFVGGPTGGVALEQGKEENFVSQSGVHKGQNDE